MVLFGYLIALNCVATKTSLAAFGVIPYGSKLVGHLELAEPLNACSYIKQSTKDFAQHPVFVAMRGECPFVTKAHFAQLAGAKMLLVVDNEEEDVSKHVMIDKAGQSISFRCL